ncbi:hypothetical protein D1641_08265 [Colidextribacter sp. OB.20]|nr:hypothetical protein [Colidextribacter sp. OB.20]
MAPSTYSPTGKDLDCYIAGDGFFMLGDKLTRVETYYMTEDEIDADEPDGGWSADDGKDGKPVKPEIGSLKSVSWTGGVTSGEQLKDYELSRVGDFWIDPDGYVCNGDGKIVYGFGRVQNPYYIQGATKAQIQKAKDQGIDIESETIISTHLIPLRVPLKAAAPTEANGGKIYVQTDANGNETILPPDAPADDKAKAEVRYLWEEGDPVYPFLSAEVAGLNQYADPELATTSRATMDADGKIIAQKGSRIAVAANTASDAVSNVMPCQMREVAIGTDGSITGTANGKTVVLGYIAVASADNPNGVTHTGGPYYKCMPGAGNMTVSTLGLELPSDYLGNKLAPDDPKAGEGNTAAAIDRIPVEKESHLESQGLEASSTDLAYEFAEMITTQRGYQANTRIVTVTDSMLEELVNMKR